MLGVLKLFSINLASVKSLALVSRLETLADTLEKPNNEKNYTFIIYTS
ncbi:hypothetical protein AB670_01862 [Chryseobacterium sp. MOF25P]|nr:hypothetical protein AB670_01862 [Chryseobacterium sp. MOF25P]OBW46893.1 hypothetical protein AB671_00988 [Chryseobacterium sp. BGARF1]